MDFNWHIEVDAALIVAAAREVGHEKLELYVLL
jgi:hypothetical protein